MECQINNAIYCEDIVLDLYYIYKYNILWWIKFRYIMGDFCRDNGGESGLKREKLGT